VSRFPAVRALAALLVFLMWPVAASAESFTVADIRVQGLQRIPLERVYAVLPVRVGGLVDEKAVAHLLREVYATGNFEDVQVLRDGDVLVVRVAERPAISSIEIKGNKSINTDDLLKGLEQAGLSEGEVFRRSTLDNMQVELRRQYIAQGRYGVVIETEAVPQPRNRVALKIEIIEGKPARISSIRFIGNEQYDDETLARVFKLKERHFWSFIKNDDKYARERLSGDLEALRSHYFDRGHLAFRVDSTQVSVTPDRSEVAITIVLHEGARYQVSEVNLAGNLVIDEKELRPLILVRPQQTFSQQLVTLSTDILEKRLGLDGYVFAEVKMIPEVDEEAKTAKLTFFVEPGDRAYVNRITFSGNNKTRDDVLRREMRQFEGAPASQAAIDLGKRRLEQLGFFSTVKADTPRVPGENDRIDVNYTVEEQPSGSIGANVGYSQGYGLVFGANVSQNNFFGTGNRVSFALSRSEVRDSASFSFNDPYYTDDGVSRGFSVYYTQTDYSSTSLSGYAIDRAGANVSFGYPISEVSRLTYTLGPDRSRVLAGYFAAEELWAFLDPDGLVINDSSVATVQESYDSWLASLSWSRSTLNRGVLADRGAYNRVVLEASVPGSDLHWYKLGYNGQRYFPLTRRLTLRGRLDLGYGDGYGDDEELPFFHRYTAGGYGSVRGWEDRSLGHRSDSHAFAITGQPDADPDPVGGNVQLEGGLELIFPTPFARESRSVRTSLFLDAGNVFLEGAYPVEPDEIRLSTGVALSWYTAIGPLSFSLARTLNEQVGDERQVFQFSLGQPF
jgi:outer membrane protein insertion porin family